MLRSRVSSGVRVKRLVDFLAGGGCGLRAGKCPGSQKKNKNCLLDLHPVSLEAQSCRVKWPEPCGRRRAGWILLEWALLQVCSKP